MQRFCTGVLAGCLLSLFLPALPVFFKIIFLSLLLLSVLYRQWFFAGIFALCSCWHFQLQAYLLAQRQVLAPIAISSTLTSQSSTTIQVKILSWRLLGEADIDAIVSIEQGAAKGYKLKLRWRDAPAVTVGEHWRLSLQLRAIRYHSNPGRRQQDIQALLQAIVAEGYVIPQQPAILLSSSPAVRQQLIEQIRYWTADLQSAPLLMALTVGERQFSSVLWRGVQHSGLGHILTISGLHIGLVFGWGYLLSGALLKCRPFSGWQPQTTVSIQLLSALFIACCYAYLAGFAIPTLRAAAALLLIIGSRLLLRPLNGRYAWQLLVALLLLLNPFWVLSYSFWLSVLAVAIIILLSWWLPQPAKRGRSKLAYFLIFQLMLTMSMSLIGIAFFDGVSVLAILSNVIFVSWCSLVAIPLLLFTLCWSLLKLPFMTLLWQATDWVFYPLWYWLLWCAEQPVWWSVPGLGLAVTLLLAGAAVFIVALRLPRVAQLLLSFTIITALMLPATRVPKLLLLDTGQSTVMLAQHEGLNWLYLDADVGRLEGLVQHTVLPQLRYQRWRKLDLVLIPDLNREMYPALRLLQQFDPEVRFYSATPVLAGSHACQQIVLDYPQANFKHWALASADPCTISVNLAGWHLLLPGRLNVGLEQQLMQRYPELQSDLYLLADYGRPSANSLAWLAQLSPGITLLSANEQGAYRYPLAAVEQRIMLLGLPLYHSGRDGAIRVDFSADKIQINAQKQQWRLRWLEKPVE